jgi:branched-chain amino acid transport system substrate-binding protein
MAAFAAVMATVLASGAATAQTPTGEPIRIGYGMALTGPLASNGKSALLAHKIWEADVNAHGGLLGRPVKLVYYDDQSNPSTVPGIYTKLLDVDKVDLVVGGYATNQVAPAMPVVIAKKKMFIALLALDANAEFKYPDYFSMTPTGPKPKGASIKGFFDVAMRQNPKPQTVAIVAADAEFSRNAADGARENAKANKLKIVYDRTYPPATTDFTPIVRAIQASNPDLLAICSYPLDSVGMVRAINEVGFTPKMVGGSMVGLQATAFKLQLGPKLNGIVNYDFWLPLEKMKYTGTAELFKKYQARAAKEGVDPLGYYMAPWAYSQMQVLAQAVEGAKSLNDQKLGAYIRSHTFKTVGGDISFGKNGEWAKARVLQVQFHGITGNDLDQFRDMSRMTVLDPPEYASGKVIYPYANAKK